MSVPAPASRPQGPGTGTTDTGGPANPAEPANSTDMDRKGSEEYVMASGDVIYQAGPTSMVVHSAASNPCCMPLQAGIYLIVIMEVFAYLVGLGFYIFWYLQLTNMDDNFKRAWKRTEYYRTEMGRGASFEEVTKYLRILTMIELIICSLYVVLTILLLVAGIRRIAWLAAFWVAGIVLFAITRLVLLILAPLPAYQLGFVWFIFEIYFMYVVGCFVVDCQVNPDGLEVYTIPYTEPIYPVYGGYAYTYPIVGYQLVGYNTTAVVTTVPQGQGKPGIPVRGPDMEPRPTKGRRFRRTQTRYSRA